MNFTNKCSLCNSIENVATPLLSNEQRKDLLNRIYLGRVSVRSLPLDLYLQIGKEYEDNLLKGFGDVVKPNEITMIKSMRDNCYHFAAAKTYQMVRQCEANKTTGKGMVSEDKFNEKCESIVVDFLGAYMFAETDTAKAVGKTSKKWANTENRISVPYLEYVTKKDNRVRPAHVYLDGIIRNAQDVFWDKFYPPNGWLCRCTVKATKEGENTDLKDFDKDEMLKNVPEMFRQNFSKAGIVFSGKHPYFRVPRNDKAFAKTNFGLLIPHGN